MFDVQLDLESKITLIRSAGLFAPILVGFAILHFRSISYLQLTGMFIAFLWCFSSLTLINAFAIAINHWSFNVIGGVFMGIPMDLLLGWALLWAIVPNLLGLKINIFFWSLLLLVLDFIAMPLLEPVVQLESQWWISEGAALLIGFIPSKILYDLTVKKENLRLRSLLQFCLYSMCFVILIPWMVLENSSSLVSLRIWSFESYFILFQAYVFLSILGLSALQELTHRGGGTPFPLDPTENIVVTGPYAYVRNPMQVTQIISYLFMGLVLENFWLLGLGVVSFVYSVGFALWSESQDMKGRFGTNWLVYKNGVRNFIPRWKPWRLNSAVVFLDRNGCSVCSDFSEILIKLGPEKLIIQEATMYPGDPIHRMTYQDSDGYEEQGIQAIGRVLEHVNFFWAFVGFFLRLPLVSHFGQILLDGIAPPHVVCSAKKV